jgi:hypothetical protein
LHKVCSIYIHLYLWKNILIGQSCWLSCYEVWYSSDLEILPFLFKVFGEFILIKYKTIVSHTPQLVSNSYQIQIWYLAKFKPSTYAACYCVEFWSSRVDPCWEIYHAPKIKITYTPHTHAAPTLGIHKNMLPSRSTKNSAPTPGVGKNMFIREILHVLKR